MPPRVRVTKEKIIEAAVSLVKSGGAETINARSIAISLGCSTQPIFSNFKSMKELIEDVIASAYGYYLGFLERELQEGKYPPYKAFGMAYIRFAREEKELFKLLFMREREAAELTKSVDFERSCEMIMSANGVSREAAERMHLEMWIFVHGVGAVLASSFLPLESELISDMISDVYHGLCMQLEKE